MCILFSINNIGISQYQKQNSVSTLGIPYDYYSVMHYSPGACSTGGPTMIFPHYVNANNVGLAAWLTPYDIAHINRRYCSSG